MGVVDAPKSIWTLSDPWPTRPPTASSFLLTKGAHTPQSLQGRAAMSPWSVDQVPPLMCFLLLSRLISGVSLCPDDDIFELMFLIGSLSPHTSLEAGLLTPQAEPTVQPSEIWQIPCHLVHEPDPALLRVDYVVSRSHRRCHTIPFKKKTHWNPGK